MKALIIQLLCMAALVACSGNGAANQDSSGTVKEGPAGVAQKTAAHYAGVSYKDVEVISVEALEFSDSSLGCPETGMAYLQVITPGHIVIVQVNGPDGSKTLDIRVSGELGKICTNNSQ